MNANDLPRRHQRDTVPHAAVWLLAAALLTNCKREAPDQAESDQGAATPTEATSVSVSSGDDKIPTAATSSRAPSPKLKQYETTPAASLGNLPEGLGLTVGKTVPKLAAEDSEGKLRDLAQLYADRPLLLVFYRGGWCPFCNFQIREFSQSVTEFERRGVQPVFISVDRVSEAARTKAAHEIPFPVLSDPKLTVHRAFNLLNQMDESQVERLQRAGLNLHEHSGETHNTVAVPAMFLIDEKGVVQFAHADRNYKVRPSMEQVLAAVDQALARKNPASDP